MVNMENENDNKVLVLERPIFKLLTNDSAEEMGLQGSDDNASATKFY